MIDPYVTVNFAVLKPLALTVNMRNVALLRNKVRVLVISFDLIQFYRLFFRCFYSFVMAQLIPITFL